MLLAAALAAFSLSISAGPAAARDDVVRSFDGTPIAVSFFRAQGLEPGERAPTVLVGHGWGGSRYGRGDETSGTEESLGPAPLLRQGYNVLTWDARGFGESGGTVRVDSPRWEARDVRRLTSYVARERAAELDGPGDPRVGMAGGSYGGAIQLNTAAIDGRVDAIVPGIAWHSLLTSLDKRRAPKGGWGSFLFGVGVPTSLVGGVIGGVAGEAGLQTGTLHPQVTRAFANGLVRGELSPANRRFFRSRGPGRLVSRIEAPTLLVQGTADTLFTLQEAITNYRVLRRVGTPVKMLWFCGGHGVCSTVQGTAPLSVPPEQGGYARRAALRWFARHLKERDVRTGPGFRWFADDGGLRSAPRYPLPTDAVLRGTGSGTLALAPGGGAESGTVIAASPSSAQAVEATVGPARRPGNLVKAPLLRVAYSGTAAPARTKVYAQLVDEQRGMVVGNQVDPVPLVLDGQRRRASLRMEVPSARVHRGDRYKLQIIPGTSVYFPQRAAGAVELHSARVSLPVSR
jgi:ABC-2 type transport system ATP-binding protein